MTYLLLITIILLITLIMRSGDDPVLEISRHSEQLNAGTLLAIFQTMRNIENREKEDIQFLINSGLMTKEKIEQEADDLCFSRGEFPAESLMLEPKDFARLVNVYQHMIKNYSDKQVSHFISTLY
jgi:hypothetical protein